VNQRLLKLYFTHNVDKRQMFSSFTIKPCCGTYSFSLNQMSIRVIRTNERTIFLLQHYLGKGLLQN